MEFPQIVRYPNRYMIKRGVGMWTKVMKLLERFKKKSAARLRDGRRFQCQCPETPAGQLKRLRSVETGVAKPKRRKREFIQITREQSERLDKASHWAAEIVFRHLMFLNWKSPGRTIRLANEALVRKGINRQSKSHALLELRKLGLIKLKIRPRKSPEIVIR